MSDHERGEAYFDHDRIYRYALSRWWGERRGGPMMMFIGLNPSTADENVLDPTMRRVIGFAKREGYDGLWMGNLFAFRATKPTNMMTAADPVGPDNDRWLADMARWSSRIVLGWGTQGSYRGRDSDVRRLLQGKTLHCLKRTGSGHPGHPLYLRADSPLQVFQDALWRPGPA